MSSNLKKASDLQISPKHQKQIQKAQERQLNEFVNQYIKPTIDAYLEDCLPSLPHLFTREFGAYAHQDMHHHSIYDEDHELLSDYSLFSNPLDLADYNESDRKKGHHSGYTPPSQRIKNAGWCVFTFEHDGSNAADLEMQLDWFKGKRNKCQFSKVHKELLKYPDYRGYCAVFSGNKSVHIHLLFDTKHLDRSLHVGKNSKAKAVWDGDLPPEVFSLVYRDVWQCLTTIICDTLNTDVVFDQSLGSYIQKRRLPWGHRKLTQPSALHGFGAGDLVEQTVIQEQILGRASVKADHTPLFTIPDLDQIQQVTRRATRAASTNIVEAVEEQEVLDLFVDYLKANGWSTYPMPVKLYHDGVSHFLHFQNDAQDVHPSSFIRGDFRRVYLAGKGAPTSSIFLPNGLTLDETLQLIAPPSTFVTTAPKTKPRLCDNFPMSRTFNNNVTSLAGAREFLNQKAKQIAEWDGVTLLQAPEGIGKSYALMNVCQEIRWDHDAETWQHAMRHGENFKLSQGFIVFACKSYQQAHEKATEFSSVPNAPQRVVVLKSVTKLYKEALEMVEAASAITRQDAGQKGHPSLLHAIKSEQPDVYDKMCTLRDALWRNDEGKIRFDDRATVVMVHDVIKSWSHSLYSKAFLNPSFPDDMNDDAIALCAKQMSVSRVIFDELDVRDLVDVVSRDHHDFAESVRSACKQSWSEASLKQRVKAYCKIANQVQIVPFGYDRCDAILRLDLTTKDRVLLRSADYPFGQGPSDKNIYSEIDNKEYYVTPLRWYHSIGCPVTILTTEDLPRLIASGINQNLKTGASKKRIKTINFCNAPHMSQETVPMYFNETARMPRYNDSSTPSVVDLATMLLGDDHCDYVISNGLSRLPQEFFCKVGSHKSVRGRNDLQGCKIVSILTYPGLDEFAEICAVGARFGIIDPVTIYYRDMLYQNLGRNLGSRGHDLQSEDVHSVIMKPSLYKCLNGFKLPGDQLGFERYQLRLAG